MAALGYVYTLGKQPLRSHNCCTNWSANGAEFIEVQTPPHVLMHDWDLHVCAFCQVIEVGNNLVGRIVRRQPDPSPIVTSQIMTPVFAQKIVKLQAPSHHPPASGWIPPLLSTHPVTNLLKIVAWAQALHSSDCWALTHIIISVLYNHIRQDTRNFQF